MSDKDSKIPMSTAQQLKSRATEGALLFALLSFPSITLAAEGAFEMDARYYFMNLIGKNPKDQPLRKPIFKTPRTLDLTFATELLNIVENQISEQSFLSKEVILGKIKERLPDSLSYFKSFVPITKENLSDQYYFDIFVYLYYLVGGEYIKTSEERVKLRDLVGKNIIELLKRKYFVKDSFWSIKTQEKSKTEQYLEYAQLLPELGNNLKSILTFFKSTNIISDFIFDVEDFSEVDFAKASFSEGLPISFQVTLKEPATLLGFLEQAGANTFYHPDIIGTTISNYFKLFGFRIKVEDYLMDNYYRTENFVLQAQDIILEINLYSP